MAGETRSAQKIVDALDAQGYAAEGLTPVGVRPSLSEYIRQLWERRHFIWMDARHRVLSQNSRNRLGSAWLLLKPLMDAAFYFLIFGLVLNISTRGHRQLRGLHHHRRAHVPCHGDERELEPERDLLRKGDDPGLLASLVRRSRSQRCSVTACR